MCIIHIAIVTLHYILYMCWYTWDNSQLWVDDTFIIYWCAIRNIYMNILYKDDEDLLPKILHLPSVMKPQVLLFFSWSEQHIAHVLTSVNERMMINQWGLKNWSSWWLHNERLLQMKLVTFTAQVSENRKHVVRGIKWEH